MILFIYINSTCNSQIEENPKKSIFYMLEERRELFITDNDASKKKCKKRDISEYEKEELLAYKCCYLVVNCNFKNEQAGDGENEEYNFDVKACTSVDKFTYTHPDYFVWNSKDLCNTYELQCYSSYLKLMFITFIIILL